MNKRTKIFIKKFSALIVIVIVGLFSVTYVVVDNLINNIEKATQATIATNTLKNKKDAARLKTKHKKEITHLKAKHKKDIAKTKIKERSKRWVASIPFVGAVLALWSGKEQYEDFEQWQKDNPYGDALGYTKYQAELLNEP